MPALDHSIKIITDAAGRELARVAGVDCEGLQPVESTLPRTLEKLADRAFRARHGREQFVLYFEFYSRWDRNAPWDMLAKSGFLSQREHLPTVCVAFIFLRRGFRSAGGRMRLQALGRPTQQVWFREVPLWKLMPEQWWEQVPGLMALYPLCQHQRSPREAIRHSAEVIEHLSLPAGEESRWLNLLGIVGGLLLPGTEVAQILGREQVKESSYYRGIVGEGERNIILRVLRVRFGPQLPDDLVEQLNKIQEPDQLEPLGDLAAGCASLDEFRAALRPRRKRR
jgi:hypothetical protein